MADATIRIIPNGPYRLTGPARISDALGNDVVIEDGKSISLCRCGASVSKPFCDGTHSRIGFQAAEAAVRKTEP